MTSELHPGQHPTLNVFDEQIISCSEDPLTGFYRDGCCNTGKGDYGSHTICVTVTDKFLNYSKAQGCTAGNSEALCNRHKLALFMCG